MFEDLRTYYMSRYERALKEAREEFSQVASELMLDIPSRGEPELLYRIYRMDIMGQSTDGPKAIEVNVDPMELAVSLEGFGVPTGIGPLVWNGIELRVEGIPPAEVDLHAWIAKWVDVDDQRCVEGADFQSVIHNCLRPVLVGSSYLMSVDFGSAPTIAVFELLDLLAPSASAIQIGTDLATDAT